MKTHVRILYAVAVIALVAAGVALKSQNDDLATRLAAATTTTTTNTPAAAAVPGSAP
jgi:hypothetical protein